MLVLGISGGLDLPHDKVLNSAPFSWGDSAAVLLQDGKIIAAVEEERLTRIKHDGNFPLRAIQACLAEGRLGIDDIDVISYSHDEESITRYFKLLDFQCRFKRIPDPRTLLVERFRKLLGATDVSGKLSFVRHHVAHAASAFVFSGFTRALVVAVDGWGDDLSGMVMLGSSDGLQTLNTHTEPNSLGLLYKTVTEYLGFEVYSEYKVMGLAPYGNPDPLYSHFDAVCKMQEGGLIEIQLPELESLYGVVPPRKRGEQLQQIHFDLAAALQRKLEEALFHIVKSGRDLTGERNLCLAGGVAHNCTATGKILAAKMFEDVFVQPASHDAGCALGAAAFSYWQMNSQYLPQHLDHVYFGSDVGSSADIAVELERWQSFLEIQSSSCVAKSAAELVAAGKVIGWVQGRSEFGPRSLGNRSILADPRPAENKDRINAMVKRREAFRPFAPSVLEEYAGEFFEIPGSLDRMAYMGFIIPVQQQYRAMLGAITHVDGTARIQAVSRRVNPLYWDLIEYFRTLTGVPMVLNTSFNNNAEPIIESVRDAVVCFLTTGLDQLVIGNFLVSKRPFQVEDLTKCSVCLPEYVTVQSNGFRRGGAWLEVEHSLVNSCSLKQEVAGITARMHELLLKSDDRCSVGELISSIGSNEAETVRRLTAELFELWRDRLVVITPI